MERTRSEYIRDIRARLPYFSERSLSLIDSFVFGLCSREGYGYSTAEHDRPVLEPEDQKGADRATICMRTIADALIGSGSATPSYIEGMDTDLEGTVLLGWDQGDLVAVDTRQMMTLWNEAGWVRTGRAYIVEWMERSGYILPRHLKPKTIMVDGSRREIVYIFKATLQRFINEAVSA